MQPFILMQLCADKLHGFSIYTKLLESDAMDYTGTDPGGIYRTLRKMESVGLIAASWHTDETARPKRVYEITDEGRQCLKFWKDTLTTYKNEIGKMVDAISKITDTETKENEK